MTSEPRSAIEAVLLEVRAPEFAVAGFQPTSTLLLERGVIDFPVSMQGALKRLELPVEVQDSQLILTDSYLAHSDKRPLSVEQAKLLTHLDIKLDVFQPRLVCGWVDGTFSKDDSAMSE